MDLREETLNHHIVAVGSSSGPSYLGNPITSTDKRLGHVCFMGKVFKIFKSQPYSACHLT